MNNLFEEIPKDLKEEFFEDILSRDGLRIERIVSQGQSTPSGEWLSQKENEWVILLYGEAELSFEDVEENFKMSPGDYTFIASGRRHRVEKTSPGGKTVWLCVHFK